jgi:hypothetical protein
VNIHRGLEKITNLIYKQQYPEIESN